MLRDSVTRRQSVAHDGLEMAAWQSSASAKMEPAYPASQLTLGFAGFFALRSFAGLRAAATGRLAGCATVSSGSGPWRKNALQAGDSCALFRIMQTVMRSTSGISELHNRNASGVQADCWS
jgi:hypothetical protein